MLARNLAGSQCGQVIRIFYSYARDDIPLRRAFDEVLGRFSWDVTVTPWSDERIQPGDSWETEIDNALNKADLVLLFVSNHFLNSRYCMERELPVAMGRHEKGEARIIPIILEETQPDWRQKPFAKLQVLPHNCRPVSTWPDPADAYRDIAEGIVNLIAMRGLVPRTAVNWQLRISKSWSEFGLELESRVVESLRNYSCDWTLRVNEVRPGSVVLLGQCSEDGFARLKELFDAGSLDLPDGCVAVDLFALFGADVRAGLTEDWDPPVISPPKRSPDPEWMLLPSERADLPIPVGMCAHHGGRSWSWVLNEGLNEGFCCGAALEAEARKLSDYCYAAIAVPAEDLWVNLSPDEHARMIPNSLTGTSLGHVMLEMDYRLKRLSASLLHPDIPSGRAYWEEFRQRIRGSRHPEPRLLDTYHRVCIVPGKMLIRESDETKNSNSEYERKMEIAEGAIGVKVEPLSPREFHAWRTVPHDPERSAAAQDAYAHHVLPVVLKELNEGLSFAPVRQYMRAVMAAGWWLRRYREHPCWRDYIRSGCPMGTLGHTVSGLRERRVSPEQLSKLRARAEACARNVERFRAAPTSRGAVRAAMALARSLEQGRSYSKASLVWQQVFEAGEACAEVVEGAGTEALLRQGATARMAGELPQAEIVLRRALADLGRQGDSKIALKLDVLQELREILATLERQDEARALANEIHTIHLDHLSLGISENREYYRKYLQVFENGVFFCQRDEFDASTNQKVLRTYTAGAIDFRNIDSRIVVERADRVLLGRGLLFV